MASVDIVLAVAAAIEFDILLPKIRDTKKESVGPNTYWIGTFGRYSVALVKCAQGTSTRAGATSTLLNAIDIFKPHAVIMPGIAFGNKLKGQVLGDVLVSTRIYPYEWAKVANGTTEYRSESPPAGITLLDRAQSLQWSWKFNGKDRKAKFGPLLSGDKLLNDEMFTKKLFETFSDAVGGEMEGTGIYIASENKKAEWLIIKGVCDWGFEKTDGYQGRAMDNAVSFLEAMLSESGLEAIHFGRHSHTAISEMDRLTFEAMAGLVRSSEGEFRSAISEARKWMSMLDLKAISEDEKVKGRELQKQVLSKGEAWLNRLNDACNKLLEAKIDEKTFLGYFRVEVIEVFEKSAELKERLYPKEKSPYQGLWGVYERIHVNQEGQVRGVQG